MVALPEPPDEMATIGARPVRRVTAIRIFVAEACRHLGKQFKDRTGQVPEAVPSEEGKLKRRAAQMLEQN